MQTTHTSTHSTYCTSLTRTFGCFQRMPNVCNDTYFCFFTSIDPFVQEQFVARRPPGCLVLWLWLRVKFIRKLRLEIVLHIHRLRSLYDTHTRIDIRDNAQLAEAKRNIPANVSRLSGSCRVQFPFPSLVAETKRRLNPKACRSASQQMRA